MSVSLPGLVGRVFTHAPKQQFNDPVYAHLVHDLLLVSVLNMNPGMFGTSNQSNGEGFQPTYNTFHYLNCLEHTG